MYRELRNLCLLLSLLGCLVVVPLNVFGQIGGGTISGYVLDTSSAVVPGVEVTAMNLGTGVSAPTVTNNEGYYEFPLLPAGQYVIEASHAGFGNAKSEQFTLSTGTHPRIDLTMPVASTVSKVEVTGTAPILNTEKTDLGNVVDTNQVSELPLNGRGWLSLVNLQPGAQNAPSSATGSRGGMWFNGSPAYGNQLLVDGVDMSFIELTSPPTDQSAGAGTSLMGGISLGAISEVKVDSSSLPAEYGNSVGGVVNLTTKSGTNQFHGDAFEYVRATLGGWSLDGIMGIQSGIPVNILAGKDLVRNTRITGDRPDVLSGVNRYIRSTTGTLQWLNPAAFDVTDPYNAQRFGDLSYNALRAPGSFSYDAALHKTFDIRERARLTFRAEAFNIFNHPVLGGLDATVTDPKFGQLTSASSARAVQLALVLKF